jgi:hypothetical protein
MTGLGGATYGLSLPLCLAQNRQVSPQSRTLSSFGNGQSFSGSAIGLLSLGRLIS